MTVNNAEIRNNKGEALAALGSTRTQSTALTLRISLNRNYTAAQINKQAAMGKGQVVSGTNTPTPTMAPWYLGGVAPTTVTPTQVAATLTVIPPLPVPTTTTSQMTTVVATVTTKTTFSPLSLFPALPGLQRPQ